MKSNTPLYLLVLLSCAAAFLVWRFVPYVHKAPPVALSTDGGPVAQPTADGGPASRDGGPATPDGGPAPKHRLQIGVYSTADGFRSVVPPYYDTALKMTCQPATDSKGVMRCFPGGNYRMPVYRGMDTKTGECLEEVILSPNNDKTVGSLIGIGANGSGRLHKVGQKLVGTAIYIKTVDKDGKPVCVSQPIPQGTAIYALGEDVTAGLMPMTFQWTDTP